MGYIEEFMFLEIIRICGMSVGLYIFKKFLRKQLCKIQLKTHRFKYFKIIFLRYMEINLGLVFLLPGYF
jgi:hypothetical protein